MLSQENISKYGGKAAILNYVKEKLPHLNIPNYVVKEKENQECPRCKALVPFDQSTLGKMAKGRQT